MRLIDADALVAKMNLAIAMLKRTMKNFDIEDDPECQMELKAYQDIRDGIKEEPTIEPESNYSESPNGWTPCSERLPKEDHWLGGSGKQFSENVLVSVLNSADEDEWVDVSHTIDGEWALELPRHCKVLAWMPLPEPYKP